MRKAGRLLLLVVVSLAAVAITIPAAASAGVVVLQNSEWTADGVPLEKGYENGTEIGLIGEVTWVNAIGGTIACTVNANVWIWNDEEQGDPETQARNTIEKENLLIGPAESCILTGSPYGNCTLSEVFPVDLPWGSHAYVVEDEEWNRLGSIDVLASFGVYFKFAGAMCALKDVAVTATASNFVLYFKENTGSGPCDAEIVEADVAGALSGTFATSPNIGPFTAEGILVVLPGEHDCVDLQVQDE